MQFKGDQRLKVLTADNGIKVGAALCSSIISPSDYRHLSKDGANLLSNSASLATFSNSPLFDWQQKSLAKFMAVSNARPFIQSANWANAYSLDHNGNKVDEVTRVAHTQTQLYVNSKKTIYTVVDEWLVLAGLVLLVVRSIRSVYVKKIWRKGTKSKKIHSKNQSSLRRNIKSVRRR